MTDPTLAESIARLIVSTELSAGSHLTAEGLAARLGVSRTPVREALRELSAMGLVEVHGNRGAFVIDPDSVGIDEMVDLLETRRRIEPWVFGQAAIRHRPDDLAAIDVQLHAGRTAISIGDVGSLNLAHHGLLRSMVAAGHNAAVDIAVAPLHYRTSLVFARVAGVVLPDGWPLHEQLRNAIAERDRDRAFGLHDEHLSSIIGAVRAGP